MLLQTASSTLDLTRPVIMGVLNVTPDSFSDGGRFTGIDDALRHGERLVHEGAAIVDIGGESTRPGAADVSVEEELGRVVPVVEALKQRVDVCLSVDTSKAEVMTAAAAAGAGMINDVFALRRDGAVAAAASTGCAVCLMHMQGEPRTMQASPVYSDVSAEVLAFLAERVKHCVEAGIGRHNLLVDPGFGFGKTDQHNLTLLAGLDGLQVLELPVLVGLSRKRTLGNITGRDVAGRTAAGLAAAVMAVERGARVIRTHDVAATADALRMVAAVREMAATNHTTG